MKLLIDASIAVKWFHARGEDLAEESRLILDAIVPRSVGAAAIDLMPYEVANVLLRRHGWTGGAVKDVLRTLGDTLDIVVPTTEEMLLAADLRADHELTYYDAAYAAVALQRRWTLVTADGQLLDGFGRSPADVAAEL